MMVVMKMTTIILTTSKSVAPSRIHFSHFRTTLGKTGPFIFVTLPEPRPIDLCFEQAFPGLARTCSDLSKMDPG